MVIVLIFMQQKYFFVCLFLLPIGAAPGGAILVRYLILKKKAHEVITLLPDTPALYVTSHTQTARHRMVGLMTAVF